MSDRDPVRPGSATARLFVPGVDAAAIEPLLRDPAGHGASILKRNPKRAVYRVEGPIGPLVVKVHSLRGGAERLGARLFGTRARREIETARAIASAGVRTPEAVALLEDPGAGIAASAVRAIDGAAALGPYLEQRFRPRDGRGAEKRSWLARAVGLLAALHRAGFDHRDFHGGNLLVDAGGELFVIDLHRVARGAPSRRRRLRAIADLVHTLRFALDPSDDAFAIAEYARVANRPDLAGASSLAELRAVIARRERKRVRSRSKRCLVESSAFSRVATGGCRGFRRRDRDEAEIFAAIAAATEQIESGGPLLRSISRRSSVAIGAAGGRRYAVKIYHGDGFKRLRGRATGGRGKRAWRAAHALDVRGIAVARPVAWIQTPDRSILVTDEVEDAVPLHVLSFALGGDASGRARRVARAVSDLVGDVFEAAVSVNDLSPKNVLVQDQGGRIRAVLCDFDGVRLRTTTPQRMIENLAQLNDLAPTVGATPRLLVLRRLKRRAAVRLGRGAASAILVATARRAARALAPLPAGALSMRVN